MIQEKAISLPFTITAQGNVAATNSQSKIWQDKVFSVIATSIGERVNRQLFGTKISTENFNVSDGKIGAQNIIQNEVNSAFSSFLPKLRLVNVMTDFSIDSSTVTVTVDYQMPNQTNQSVVLGSFQLNGNQPIQEM
jgi:phage baseplate assembly protein W